MKTPQIVLIAMIVIGALLEARDHGKPRKNHNFWMYLISIFITLGILYCGGFFN